MRKYYNITSDGQIILDIDPDLMPHGREYRSKMEYGYSYDPIMSWKNHSPNSPKSNSTVYTDRFYLPEWGPEKFNQLRNKHDIKNDYSSWENPENVQAFLREYMNDGSLILNRIVEYCNASSGFPYYRLDYYSKTNVIEEV